MSSVLHRNLHQTLPLAVGGEGIHLIDAEGKRYIDASGGAAVSCLGHSHPAVIAAIRDQVGRLPYAHTSFFANEPSEALAAFLIERAPPGFAGGRVAFCGSGSEATEIALKLARQYHLERGDVARSHFISRFGSYHGNTLGALAVGGHPGRREPYAPMLMPSSQIEACHVYRNRLDDETEETYGRRAADALETEILRVGPENVAAFIVEPVGGATMGCVPPVTGYFARIRQICDTHGVLLIADEVMCGMGRTGRLFALAEDGVSADIVTVAKGLGAGYQPIGAVLASGAVVEALYAGSGKLANGHTYMSHPVACAGALAALTAVEEEGLLDRVRSLGEELLRLLTDAFGNHRNVGDIRGRGLFYAVELVADRASKAPFPAALGIADKIRSEAMANGLICYPSSGGVDGVNGDHVLIAPPFICSAADLATIVSRLTQTVETVLAKATNQGASGTTGPAFGQDQAARTAAILP